MSVPSSPGIPVFLYQNLGREETSSRRTSLLNGTEASDVEKILIKLFKSGVVLAPIEGPAFLYAVRRVSQ
ncbi:hypothetical protein C8R48DRAFT_772810 [Suillus tomentosus]|nr:hypothetical protein C8R48DRAFT_772810 [Suillus tomentosus]